MIKKLIFVTAIALACVGTAHADSMTGGGISPVNPNTWAVQSEQTCVTPKVGSTFTPTCPVNYITIDAAGETINIPSNMPANGPPGATAYYTLDITYTGAFTPAFGTGTQWPNKTALGACSGSVTGCLSSVNGAHDRIMGQSLDASDILYGVVLTNYGVPSAVPVAVVQNTSDGGSGSCGNGTSVTTGCSVTISGVVSGHTLTVAVGWCNHVTAVDCSNTTTAPITSINAGCTLITGTSLAGATNVSAYRCTGLSGAVAINPQWGAGAPADYPSVFVVEWSNEAGAEAGFSVIDSASPFTITTGNGTGTLSQTSGEAAYAFVFGGGSPVVSSPTLALNSYAGAASGYQISSSNAQVANQFTGTGSAKLLTFALKHI